MYQKILLFINHPIGLFIQTILSVSFTHYILWYLFFYLCIPSGFLAPIYHIFYMGSPFCVALNTIQNYLLNNYITIWTTGVISLIAYLKIKKNND
jgi:hypothetical protein